MSKENMFKTIFSHPNSIFSFWLPQLDESLLTGLLSGIMAMFKEAFKSGSDLRYIHNLVVI